MLIQDFQPVVSMRIVDSRRKLARSSVGDKSVNSISTCSWMCTSRRRSYFDLRDGDVLSTNLTVLGGDGEF